MKEYQDQCQKYYNNYKNTWKDVIFKYLKY